MNNIDAKILATDLDTQVLNTCRLGQYDEKRLQDLPHSLRKKWFQPSTVEGTFVVDEQLKKCITFNQLNLLGPWPMKGKFDVIFCRNVLIYFDKPTQYKVVSRFKDVLLPNGFLMLGHSESILKGSKDFAHIGKTIYRKIG